MYFLIRLPLMKTRIIYRNWSQSIRSIFYDNDCMKMKAFTDKYGKTLKSITITFYDMSNDDLKTCLIELSLFENLAVIRSQYY